MGSASLSKPDSQPATRQVHGNASDPPPAASLSTSPATASVERATGCAVRLTDRPSPSPTQPSCVLSPRTPSFARAPDPSLAPSAPGATCSCSSTVVRLGVRRATRCPCSVLRLARRPRPTTGDSLSTADSSPLLPLPCSYAFSRGLISAASKACGRRRSAGEAARGTCSDCSLRELVVPAQRGGRALGNARAASTEGSRPIRSRTLRAGGSVARSGEEAESPQRASRSRTMARRGQRGTCLRRCTRPNGRAKAASNACQGRERTQRCRESGSSWTIERGTREATRGVCEGRSPSPRAGPCLECYKGALARCAECGGVSIREWSSIKGELESSPASCPPAAPPSPASGAPRSDQRRARAPSAPRCPCRSA